MTCGHCGAINGDDAAACSNCGAPLATPPMGSEVISESVRTPAPIPPSPHDQAAAAFERAFASVTPHVFLTQVLMALNVIAFVVMAAAGMPIMKPPVDFLIRWGATYGPAVTQGEWWRLLTGMFMHAGLLHLLFNMWALFSIGLLTERLFGNVAFLIIYMVAGLGGALAGLYWHPITASVGASGAIFGLYGALFAFMLRQHATIPRHFFTSVGAGAALFLVYNLVFGLGDPGIDMAAHIGGLLAGAVAGLALARPLVPAPLAARVRRNTIAGAVSLAALVVMALRLPPVDDFLAEMGVLAGLEQKSQQTVARSLEQLREGALTDEQFADGLEQQVIRPWRAQRQTMARMRLPKREHDLALQAVKYMDLRADAWTLVARGVRTRDNALILESNNKQAAAAQAAAEFTRALNPGAPPAPAAPAVTAVRGNVALQREFLSFRALEPRMVAAYNSAVADLRSKKLTNTAFADRVEQELLPEWDAQRQRLLAVQATGADETRRNELTEYMQLRGEAWRLTARGIRTQSARTLREAAAMEARAMALAQPLAGPRRGSPPPAGQPSAPPR